jgi:hypothetical protein
MNTFTAAPYNLALNAVVVALVEAQNSEGYGPASVENTGI